MTKIRRKLLAGIMMFCMMCVANLQTNASDIQNECIFNQTYDVVSENDIQGLIELALEQENESSNVRTLAVTNDIVQDNSLYVEQVVQEKKFKDETVEQTKMLSIIDVVDPETGDAVDVRNSYGSALIPNELNNQYCYVVQTLYFTAEYFTDMNLINTFRPDNLTVVVQSGGSNIMVLTQKGYVTGTMAWEEGNHEVTQSISNPINGGSYNLACGISRFMNATSSFYHMEVTVVLSNGQSFSSHKYIFEQPW